MPKSRANKRKENRDFLTLKDSYVKENYLKWFDLAMKNFIHAEDLREQEVRFMLFFYDYEWCTMERIAEDYGRSYKKLYDRTIRPLKKKGYIEDYYSHGVASAAVDQMLGISHKVSRICLSHKGRHAVQRFYRMLDGREEIAYYDLGSGGRPTE